MFILFTNEVFINLVAFEMKTKHHYNKTQCDVG